MSLSGLVTEHAVHIALALAVCGFAALFGILRGIAAVSQLVKKTGPIPALLMLGGSLGVLAAAIDCLLGGGLDWLIMLLGGSMVCLAAVCNGKRTGKLHPAHHLIRAGMMLILVVGFICV